MQCRREDVLGSQSVVNGQNFGVTVFRQSPSNSSMRVGATDTENAALEGLIMRHISTI